MRSVALLASALLLASSSRPAEACIPIPDATGFADMDSRRAVIWIRQQTFEIMFQNRYSGDAQDFAWVIPLPGVPTEVGQPSDSFFTDLDKYTSPMFENRSCTIPCRDPNGAYDAGIPLPGVDAPPPDVTVWDTGKLGDLEYVVLSASTVADLTGWLQPRDFALPTELLPLVQDYLDQGFAFFAAKIAASAQQPASVPVVRFTFDRAQTKLVYPLRISASGRQSPLDTLIWVIAADSYLPKAPYPSQAISDAEHTQTSYEQALTQVTSQAAGTTFAIQYAAQPSVHGYNWDDPGYKREQIYYTYGTSDQPELLEVFSNKLRVVRLRASLNPMGTVADLELEQTPSPLDVSGWYLSPCPGGVVHEPCPQPDPETPTEAGVPRPAPDAGVSGDGPSATLDSGASNNPRNPGTSDRGGCQIAPVASLPTLALLGLAACAILFGRRQRRRGC